jgi:hypothetical protein
VSVLDSEPSLPVRIHDVEPGRLYRFTFRRPPVEGSRKRTMLATPATAFWGEVTLRTDGGLLRVSRDEITHVREVFASVSYAA